MNKLFLAGLLLCTLATVLSIISTAIPYWVYYNESVYTGLWKICLRDRTHEIYCTKIDDLDVYISLDWLKAVRALMIIGILCQALGTILGCLFSKYDSEQSLYKSMIVAIALAATVILIAVIVYGAKDKKDRKYFNAGFYLAIVSAVLSLVSASLVAVSSRSTGGYNTI